MKKSYVLLFIILLLFTTVGCSKGKEFLSKSEVESLVGYMVLKDNTLYFDEVEIVKAEDEKRLKELGLKASDMVTTYIIINEKEEEISFELAEEVKYTFTDFDKTPDPEKKSDENRLHTTTKKEEFINHLGDLNNIPLSEQKIPYFIKVQNGKVISIEEKLEYTI